MADDIQEKSDELAIQTCLYLAGKSGNLQYNWPRTTFPWAVSPCVGQASLWLTLPGLSDLEGWCPDCGPRLCLCTALTAFLTGSPLRASQGPHLRMLAGS